MGLDVTFAELGAEALEEADLLIGEGDLALAGGLLQAQQAVVLGRRRLWALPDASHAAGGDLDAAQHQFLGDSHRAMAGIGHRMVEDRCLDLGRHPVGCGPRRRASGRSAPRLHRSGNYAGPSALHVL